MIENTEKSVLGKVEIFLVHLGTDVLYDEMSMCVKFVTNTSRCKLKHVARIRILVVKWLQLLVELDNKTSTPNCEHLYFRPIMSEWHLPRNILTTLHFAWVETFDILRSGEENSSISLKCCQNKTLK